MKSKSLQAEELMERRLNCERLLDEANRDISRYVAKIESARGEAEREIADLHSQKVACENKSLGFFAILLSSVFSILGLGTVALAASTRGIRKAVTVCTPARLVNFSYIVILGFLFALAYLVFAKEYLGWQWVNALYPLLTHFESLIKSQDYIYIAPQYFMWIFPALLFYWLVSYLSSGGIFHYSYIDNVEFIVTSIFFSHCAALLLLTATFFLGHLSSYPVYINYSVILSFVFLFLGSVTYGFRFKLGVKRAKDSLASESLDAKRKMKEEVNRLETTLKRYRKSIQDIKRQLNDIDTEISAEESRWAKLTPKQQIGEVKLAEEVRILKAQQEQIEANIEESEARREAALAQAYAAEESVRLQAAHFSNQDQMMRAQAEAAAAQAEATAQAARAQQQAARAQERQAKAQEDFNNKLQG